MCCRLVVQGRLGQAAQQLERNDPLRYDEAHVLERLLQLLETLPSISRAAAPKGAGGAAASVDDFVASFEQWQQQCQQFAGACVRFMMPCRRNCWTHCVLTDEAAVRNNPNLETLMQLLLGNVDRLAEFSDTWYELLVARLVYSKPQMMKVCLGTLLVVLLLCSPVVDA